MASPIPTVRPGDLIRADDYNQLITVINDLTDRVSRLESSVGGPTGDGAPVVEAISPTPARLGDTILISGRQFDFGIGAARVAVDGLSVTLLAGSSDTTLIFQLPLIAGFPQGGRPVALVISNALTSTTRSILILPELPQPQGSVSIQFQDTQPATITADQQCVFHYRLVSGANLPVTLTVNPTASVAAWQAGLQILDDTGAPVPSRRLTVGALLTRDFFVRVPQLTGAATQFTLSVAAQGQGLVADSGSQGFVIGQAGTQDPDTRMSVTAVIRTGQGPDPLSGSAITLKTGERAEVDLVLQFSRIGRFDFAAVLPPGSGWAVAQIPPPIDVAAGDIAATGPQAGWATVPALFVITAPDSAGSADLVVSLQRQGGQLRRTLTFHLLSQP